MYILINDLKEVNADWGVVLPLHIALGRLLAVPFLTEKRRNSDICEQTIDCASMSMHTGELRSGKQNSIFKHTIKY